MTTTRPRTRLRAAIATIGGMALAATLIAAAPVAAASPSACRVKNLDTGVTKASLQKAHDAARAGHRLTIRGTCVGITTVRKSLTITGIRTATSGKPFLDAKLNGTVVTVRPGVKLTMRGLTIRNGATDGDGGAILVDGASLILRDVVVRGSSAAGDGGGIFVDHGTLTLNGSSSIRGNSAGHNGGGVLDWGTLVMNGSSSVNGNTAEWSGGGVFNAGYLVMNGSSSIHHNSAGDGAGGISMHSGTSNTVGAVCGPEGNVHDNLPYDCAPLP